MDAGMVTALGVILFGIWEGAKWWILRKDAREQKARDAATAAALAKAAVEAARAHELTVDIKKNTDGIRSDTAEVAKAAADRAAADRDKDRAALERTAALAVSSRPTTPASEQPGHTTVENVEQMQTGKTNVSGSHAKPPRRAKPSRANPGGTRRSAAAPRHAKRKARSR